jgi:hypothetical protein
MSGIPVTPSNVSPHRVESGVFLPRKGTEGEDSRSWPAKVHTGAEPGLAELFL